MRGTKSKVSVRGPRHDPQARQPEHCRRVRGQKSWRRPTVTKLEASQTPLSVVRTFGTRELVF